MLLKEDYFKDIDITDDDIQTDNTITSFLSLDDIKRHAKMNFQQTIRIYTYTLRSKKDKPHIIGKASKKLIQLLDIYGISHSPAYTISGDCNNSKDADIKCEQYENFINIVNTRNFDYDTNLYDYNFNQLLIYTESIRFHNIKRMMRFINHINSILFKDDFVVFSGITFISSIFLPFDKIKNSDSVVYKSLMLNRPALLITDAINMFEKRITVDNPNRVRFFMQKLIRWFFGQETWDNFRYQAACGVLDYKAIPGDIPYSHTDL